MDTTERSGAKKRYVIDGDDQALQLISDLFSSRLLTKEIRNYLEEIIENDTYVNKIELCMRMEKFFPYCLDQQFYVKADDFMKNIINGCFANFYGYWFVMSHLGQNRNFILEIQKDKFSFFLKFLEGEKTSIDLSFQNLNGCDLHGIDFRSLKLKGANLCQCNLIGCAFENAYIEDSNFMYARMQSTHFSNTTIINTNFQGANLAMSAIETTEMLNCKFNSNHFWGTNFGSTNIVGSSFDGCTIHYAVFENYYRYNKSHKLSPEMFLTSKGIRRTVGLSEEFIKEVEELRKHLDLPVEDN